MRYAVENNTGVKKQVYSNSTLSQNKLEAGLGMLPQVGASIGASTNYGRTIDPSTNTYSNTANFNNNYSIAASMQVFGGFSAINALRSARVLQLMGNERLQQAKDETALKAMQAFFDVVYYTRSVEISKEQLDASQKNLEKSRKQGELGLKSDADVAQVEAQVASDELLLVQQQNLQEIAYITLKEQMNFPLSDTLVVDTNVGMESGSTLFSLNEIFDFALKHNPKVTAAGFNFRSTQLEYYAAKGRLLPSLSVSGGYSTNYFENLNSGASTIPFSTQFRDNRGSYISASLSIPIFSGLYKYGNVVRSRNQMRIAEQQSVEVEREVQKEILQTNQQLRGYEKELAQATKKVAAAELAYRAAQEKFDKGLVDAIDLQTAANQLLQAKSQQLNASLQYVARHRMMEYYSGKPLIR